MKVAFLLYGLVQNGGTKVIFRVGDLLQQRGHEVTMVVACPPQGLPFPSNCRFVHSPRFYPNAIGRVQWLSRVAIEADIAFATAHQTALALQCNRSAIERKMYYVQAYEPDFYSDSVTHLASRWPMMLMAGASYLLPLRKIVNCDGSRRGLQWRERLNAAELPPGIDLSLYRPKPKANARPVIGHISRSEHWKGSDHFFRAMVRLRELGYEFDVRVAYDLWPNTYGLQYETAHPRCEAELAEYYRNLDALISTVTQKGFGYPPLEAMASGAICLSTPIDFGRPMIDHIPILAHSTASIVRGAESFFAGHNRGRMLQAGLETAQTYSWELLAQRWCAVLDRKDDS